MSNNRLTFQGLEDLKAALRRLPDELTGEAGHLIQGAANSAAHQIRQAYPVRTGKLRDGVVVQERKPGRFGVLYVVKNSAKHAKLFEHGTQARHTKLGANRGSMPPGHVFVPVLHRERRRMLLQLADLLRRKGLVVTNVA